MTKGPIKGRGRPKGAPNKPKSTTRDPSAFEILEKKRKREEQLEEEKENKKKKLTEEEDSKKKKKKLPAKNKRKESEENKSTEKPEKKTKQPEQKKPTDKKFKQPVVMVKKSQQPAPKPSLRSHLSRKTALKEKKNEDEDEDEDEEIPPPEPEELQLPIPKKTEEPPKKILRPIRVVKCPPPPENPRFVSLLPEILQPFVSKALDVDSDGHCGFRVAAHCLGRGQNKFFEIRKELHDHLKEKGEWYKNKAYIDDPQKEMKRIHFQSKGPCPKSHWMSMPSTGDLMANAFQTPVFFWSPSYSQTFFPHFCPPNDNPPISFAFLPSLSHFVVVELKNPFNFPAPRVLNQWRNTAWPEALEWEKKI